MMVGTFITSHLSILNMKNKRITKRTIQRDINTLSRLVLANKSAIDVIGDFLYNYLDMKGETELYTKFMEEKIDGFIQESGEGNGEVPREPIQEEKEEE
jgi:putative N-acetylmannosamine-6-phosphate epimerase|tara:strand:+ start:173 stop:469 length:297 start_codon:yes stop_codon:yes gene_type:complete